MMLKTLCSFSFLVSVSSVAACSEEKTATTLAVPGSEPFKTVEVQGNDTITLQGKNGELTLPAPPEGYHAPDRIASYFEFDDLAEDLNCRDMYDVINNELTNLPELERETYKIGYFVYNAQVNRYTRKYGNPKKDDFQLGEITQWKGVVPKSDDEFFGAIDRFLPECSTRLAVAIQKFQANGNLGKGEKKR